VIRRHIVDSLPAARGRVFYTADAAGPAGQGITRGRLDHAGPAGLGLATDVSAYLCGPTGFMITLTAALAGVGLKASEIHTERFESLAAINAGVIAADRPAPHAPALLEPAEACDVPTKMGVPNERLPHLRDTTAVRRRRLLPHPARGTAHGLRPTASA
jgi:hypothetical protein